MENRIAAIWARVSTEGQAELSLDGQIERAKAKLEAEGYAVLPEYIFSVDWTSLDLEACLEFQRLEAFVVGKNVNAIGMLDRDRLDCKPWQRVRFLTHCKENGVKPIVCQGPPFLEGDEGDLVEFVLAMGKHKSVERAGQGSKDGLHDRVVLKGLPTSHHRIYGYQWSGETLIPHADWEVVNLIYDMALEGKTYETIIRELKQRGIPSPSGKEEWCKPTISSILRNPVYGGRYYALKKEATQPITRTRKTYGNSSQRTLPFEQWKYLPKVQVVKAPVTWEKWLKLQERLKRNQELAQRNGKADYLLRGFILCDYHRGKYGEPRRYHGQPHHGSWRYVCPVGGDCPHPYLNGPRIEELVKLHTAFLLGLQPDEFYDRISKKGSRVELEASLRKELDSLEVKRNKNLNAKTHLEAQRVQGEYEDEDGQEVYSRLKLQYDTETRWIKERRQAIEEQLSQLGREAEAAASLEEIRAQVGPRLHELSKDEWRELFRALSLEVHARDDAPTTIWPGDWEDEIPPEIIDLEICFGLPLKTDTETVGSIVLKSPGLD